MEIINYNTFLKSHSKHYRNHAANLSVYGYMLLAQQELEPKEKSVEIVNDVIKLYQTENGNRFSSYVYYRTVTNGWNFPYIFIYGKE